MSQNVQYPCITYDQESEEETRVRNLTDQRTVYLYTDKCLRKSDRRVLNERSDPLCNVHQRNFGMSMRQLKTYIVSEPGKIGIL